MDPELADPQVAEAIRWTAQDANTFESPEEYVERRESEAALHRALADLNERERSAVVARFDLDGKGERTCDQIMAEWHVSLSRARVNQLTNRGLQKLKYSRHHLGQYLDPDGYTHERRVEVWVHLETLAKQREAEHRNNEKWRQHWERERRMVEAQKADAARAARAKAMDAESDRWAKLRERWKLESTPQPPVPLEPWAEKLSRHMSATYATECIEHWHERVALAERAKLFGRSIDAQYKLELRERWHTMTYTAGRVMKGR